MVWWKVTKSSLSTKDYYVRFEILTEMSLEITVFLVLTPFSLVESNQEQAPHRRLLCEVLSVLIMKIRAFLEVTPYSLVESY